jgi:hypothetical protein
LETTPHEQIISILKEHKAGMKLRFLVREYGVSGQSMYCWRAKFNEESPPHVTEQTIADRTM